MTSLSRARDAWPATLLVVLVALVYWPGRGGGFVFDDFPNIVGNAALHVTDWDRYAWLRAAFSSNAGFGHRPLAMATFALNHVFTGLDPVPMKLTNIAIHALNACLVLGMLRTLLALAVPMAGMRRREWSARFIAAAWALHPINLMAVLFVVQRMESLCHLFVFAGLWLYLLGRGRQLAGRDGGWWRIVAGIVGGTVLGLLCKESAALLPLYAACIEACLLGARGAPAIGGGTAVFATRPEPPGTGDRIDRRLLAFFGLVLVLPALAGLAWLLQGALAPGAFAHRDFTLGERLLTETRVVLDYLRWTLFPSLRTFGLYHDDIAVSHGLWQPPATAFAIAGVALLVATAVLARRRRPLLALGIAWFLCAQLLTATVVPLELVFEHRNYFASVGACLVVADLLLLAPRHPSARRIGALLAVLWLLLLGLTTQLRTREWGDPLRFAASEAAKHPRSPRAAYEYGRLLVIATGYHADSPALPLAMRELERDRALPRSGILPHAALLMTAARTGQPQREAWWEDMIARLRNEPVGVQEISAIASITRCASERHCAFPPDQMGAMFQAAIGHGENPDLLNIRADYAFNVLHRQDEALALWQRAIALRPGEPQYRINRAKVLIALGRSDEAREEIAGLRRMSRLGTTEQAARELEARMGGSRGGHAAVAAPTRIDAGGQ